MTDNDDLTQRFRDAMRTPNLIIELDRNLFGGQSLVRLLGPGKTDRSKPVPLTPVIVGEDGESHSAMLHRLADALGQAGR